MGLRLSTGLGPVRFNAPISKVVVAVVAGLCCCGGIVNAFNGDDDKKPSSAVPSDSKYAVAEPVVTPEPVVVTTKAKPSPRATTRKPSPRPTVRKTTARPEPSPTRKRTTAPTTDRQYGTCKEANAHGLGPYYKGKDPEYYWYEDRDHDGKVCER